MFPFDVIIDVLRMGVVLTVRLLLPTYGFGTLVKPTDEPLGY